MAIVRTETRDYVSLCLGEHDVLIYSPDQNVKKRRQGGKYSFTKVMRYNECIQ